MTLDGIGMDATTPANPAAPRRTCKHPKAWRTPEYYDVTMHSTEGRPDSTTRVKLGERCRCGWLVTLEAIRRGRSSRRRGNEQERVIANRTEEGRRVGHLGGPVDNIEGIFAIQSKLGPSTFSERYWHLLQAIPRTGGRIPTLEVTDGTRSMTIRMTSDDRDLHGKP